MSNPVHAARKDPRKVVLEGLHAVKHALRFGARLDGLWSDEPATVLALAQELAPDIAPALRARLEQVGPEAFWHLAERLPETRLVAVAERPLYRPETPAGGPVVLLDRPRHPGNLGAVIRVAAAAEAAAVWTSGGVDPWSAAAVRGAAGLHFALPVVAIDRPPPTGLPLIALDDEGDALDPAALPADAVYLFGSERDGLAPDLRARADRTLALPMRAGVSSLNLATAVAVVLYALRLERQRRTGQRPPLST